MLRGLRAQPHALAGPPKGILEADRVHMAGSTVLALKGSLQCTPLYQGSEVGRLLYDIYRWRSPLYQLSSSIRKGRS